MYLNEIQILRLPGIWLLPGFANADLKTSINAIDIIL